MPDNKKSSRKITFELTVIELDAENKETILFRHKPTNPCYNRHHLHNLMQISINAIKQKFDKGEL